jgi:hypothetical protein
MPRFAIIENGAIANIINADQDFVNEQLAEAQTVDVTDIYCGVGWLYQDGAFTEPHAAEPQVSLTDAIASVKTQIYDHARSILDGAIEQYGRGELASWERKEQEAKAVLSLGNATESPSLAIEAAAAEIPIEQLAQIIVAKANGYRNLAAKVTGNRTKHVAAIESMTMVEAVMSYDWSNGWQ